MAAIYLIPNTLGDCDLKNILPEGNNLITNNIRHFIVENIRTARRFLRKINHTFPIDDCTFFELNQHTDRTKIASFLEPTKKGFDIGIISEAGCPAVADPGADVVAIAQRKGIRVIPLVGPSSILLSLMGSGFNGQSFAFIGYLPIENNARTKKIKQLESRAANEGQTQIFIETPYRNMKMLSEILNTCHNNTLLCIAADITLDTEYIKTHTIGEWKTKKELPDLNKRPCIFLIHVQK
ncbi:MAG: SAM-dependent methyltransferase [Paludibacteraceae bacterium]|jgi:16S rRNA (cytidine1402-2'-O)-methyltransferase|nr:SAM-dependent methyltransferase [Paludibacteraceae bacterium]